MSLDFLLEMGWKSAAIAGVALALLLLLRSRSAADRAAVLRLSVLLLLALPAISLGLPKLEIESWLETEAAMPAPIAASAPPPAAPEAYAPPFAMLEEPVAYAPEAASFSLGLSLFLLYAAGALLVLARLLAGLWTLRRWTAAGRPPVSPSWITAFQHAVAGHGLKREVRLLVSDEVPSPMSWGRARPVILIDPASHARGEDAEAILAHEMAHVRRGDWASLMLSRLAVALFWFNPLVWMLERALIQQAEEAADLQAVNGLEPTRYAKSLIACIRCSGLHAVPANGMARADGLSRRVHAVLDARLRSMPTGGVLTVAVMLVSVLISAPLAALKLVPARAAAAAEPFAPAVPAARPTAAAAPFAAVAAAQTSVDLGEITVEAVAPAGEPAVEAAVAAAAETAPAPMPAPFAAALAPPAPQAPPAPPVAAAVQPPRVPAAPRPAAPARLDADTLVQLRVHGVDAAYMEAMQAAFGAPFTAPQLIEMRIHGLTPARIREFRDLGYRLSHRDMLQMAIHGVRGSYIRGLTAAGYAHVTPEQVVEMSIHGVTIESARKGKRLGLSVRELINRTIHGTM